MFRGVGYLLTNNWETSSGTTDRLGIALLLGCSASQLPHTTVDNPITGEKQRAASPQQEVALGLQARSEMAAQYGGLYPDNVLQQYVDQVEQVSSSR